MLGRVIATGVVVFWVTMMAALVRTEYWPSAGPVSNVPAELVLRKVFANETTDLNIYFQGQDIGSCIIDITPFGPVLDAESPAVPAQRGAYRVHTNIKLSWTLLNLRTHLSVEGDSIFNRHYAIDSFHLHTIMADGKVDVHGDALSRKLVVDFLVGDHHEQRVFDFQQVQGGGLATALGLPGFGGLGGGGGSTGTDAVAPATPPGGRQPRTAIVVSGLRLGGVSYKTYLIDTRVDDSLWSRVQVSQQGEILKVDTSFGITMLKSPYTPDAFEDE